MSETAQASRSRAWLIVPRRWLSAVAGMLVIPWLVAGAIYVSGFSAPRREPAPPGLPTESAPGPWGHLTTTPIVISPPAEYVPTNWGTPTPLLWRVPVASPGELASFLRSSGLGPDEIADLQSAAPRQDEHGGVVLMPDADLVRGLAPEVRARLYLGMARGQMAIDDQNAFRFHGPSLEAWLGPAVSDRTLALVAPFVFRHGDFLYFADIDAVWPHIDEPAERQRLAKALNRQATLLVTLRVEDPAEVPALAEYWGRGGRRTDIRPLLDSLGEAGRDGSIDISHLLPRLARDRLYRYPRLTVADHQKPVLPNCLWTALNFFNEAPDDRFLDVSVALQTLERDYALVDRDHRLGDIVVLADRDGDIFHVAVHVADGLVFGKNGISPMSPWSILPLERLRGHYVEYGDGWQVTVHRRKDLM